MLFFPQGTEYHCPAVPRVEVASSDCQLCGHSGPLGVFGHGVMVFPRRIGINLFWVILYLEEFTDGRKAPNSIKMALAECP